VTLVRELAHTKDGSPCVPARLLRAAELGKVLYPDLWRRRRASPDMRLIWAVMAGQAETPSVGSAEGFTDSTDDGGRNGCNTDGA
jgi:hypothetical protein